MPPLSVPSTATGNLTYFGSFWGRSTTALFTLQLNTSLVTNVSVAGAAPGADPDLALYSALPPAGTDALGTPFASSTNVGADALLVSHRASFAAAGAGQYLVYAAVLWSSQAPRTGAFRLSLAAASSPLPSRSPSPSPSRTPPLPSRSPAPLAATAPPPQPPASAPAAAGLGAGGTAGAAIGAALALALLLYLAHRLRACALRRREEASSTTHVVAVAEGGPAAAAALGALRPYAASNVGNPMRRAPGAKGGGSPPAAPEPALGGPQP
jgi:hypothetical protein